MSRSHDVKQLKSLVWMYLLLGAFMIILYMGVKPFMTDVQGQRLATVAGWMLTIGRAAFVIFGGLLMTKLYSARHDYRRQGLASLMIVMACLFVVLPVYTGYYHFLFALMPFPWTTYLFQILHDGTYLKLEVASAFAGRGVEVMVFVYITMQVLIFGTVALKGRRVFCSTFCGFAGCHAESFSEALPLLRPYHEGRSPVEKHLKKTLVMVRLALLVIHILLVVLWLFVLFGAKWISVDLLRTFELYKLLIFEVVAMVGFYLVFNGRGYCYYCPAGTVLSMWATAFGHYLSTNQAQCISCGACNHQCEMGINIMKKSSKGKPVTSGLCVGCGHCADACPTKTLKLE